MLLFKAIMCFFVAGISAVFFLVTCVRLLDAMTAYDTGTEIQNKNMAAGVTLMGICIGSGICVGMALMGAAIFLSHIYGAF